MVSNTGCYLIISKIHEDKFYIGSSINCRTRFKRHKIDLLQNRHANAKLQNHVNKYGIDDLIFIQISVSSRASLLRDEQVLIDSLHPFFNICPSATSRAGTVQSLSTRAKMRISWQHRRMLAWFYRP